MKIKKKLQESPGQSGPLEIILKISKLKIVKPFG